MLKWIVVIGILLGSALLAHADHIGAGFQWPGWRFTMPEEACSATYPPTYMLDGAPETAWVYNKRRIHEQPGTLEDATTFNHGVGKSITISSDTALQFTMTGLALTNGYCKDSETYWRNNRIRKITLSARREGKDWEQSFSLTETRKLQYLTFPRITTTKISITMTAVDAGRDDDLCISEIALVDNKRLLAWNLTPALIKHDSNYDCGCGGGPDLHLVDPGWNPILIGDKDLPFMGMAQRPQSAEMLLSTSNDLYLINLTSRKVLFTAHVEKPIQQFGWLENQRTALVKTATAETVNNRYIEHAIWYRFTSDNGLHLAPLAASPQPEPRFPWWVWQPQYGA